MARIFQADLITTTASGTGVNVSTYTVPTSKTFTLKVLGMGGEPTTWTTTEASLGYVYPKIAGVDKRGLEVRIMAGDVTGINIQYLIIPIPGGVTFAAAETVQVNCDPAGTTSTRWRGVIIGDEV
jgi:hypothetical protein